MHTRAASCLGAAMWADCSNPKCAAWPARLAHSCDAPWTMHVASCRLTCAPLWLTLSILQLHLFCCCTCRRSGCVRPVAAVTKDLCRCSCNPAFTWSQPPFTYPTACCCPTLVLDVCELLLRWSRYLVDFRHDERPPAGTHVAQQGRPPATRRVCHVR